MWLGEMVGHTDTHTHTHSHKHTRTLIHTKSALQLWSSRIKGSHCEFCACEGHFLNIYVQMLSAAALCSQNAVLHSNTLQRFGPSAASGGSRVDGHGSRAAPYSWAQPIKLIINLSQGLAGVADWRSRAGRRPENRTIDRISAAVRERPRSPGGRLELKPGPGSTRPSPTLFFCGAVETRYEGPCHQTHV